MKTLYKITLFLVLGLVLTTSCSRKKNSFLSRNYHALTARDNILFNGKNALVSGKEALNSSYTDNYWEILPVERLQVTDDIILPGQDKTSNFSVAEEKAVKAIQKHGMNIKGKEYNPQIDEAYLLLGKARYFEQRFVPALEAFNYILYKYPASDKINVAKIWREKTNIRLENNELAIKNLKRLLKHEELKKQDLADATAMLAQAYINTKSLDSALTQINIAAGTTKSNDERGRYRFIQGQIYNQLGYKDSANIAFKKVIALKRKTPREYYIGAFIEQAKNFDYEQGNKADFLELLTNLEENRENRPFLDKIYFQKANYYRTQNQDSLAVQYYSKSLASNVADKQLRAKAYQNLGDMYFDKTRYQLAGNYYDSTLINLKENSKPFRVIKKRRDNLEDVITYENQAKINDSILQLTTWSKAQQTAFFQKYIDTLKARAAAEKERQEIAARNQQINAGSNVGSNLGSGSKNQSNSTFYFYNPKTVAYGKNEFTKIWGNRKLEDNWRWSNKSSNNITDQTQNDVAGISQEQLYDVDFYLDQIPTKQQTIDSIAKERNFAYYQLGLIYKEKFKEYTLAKNKFNTLLQNNPEEKLILPSKYNLYKIHQLLGEESQAQKLKTDLVTNYPDTRYAAILLNPELAGTKDQNSPESIYEKLYADFNKQNYKQVLSSIDKYITAFDGEPIVPKLELLKATTQGRLYGLQAYKDALNFVALNYANTTEGQQAQQILNTAIPTLEQQQFMPDSLSSKFKRVYTFTANNLNQKNTFKNTVNQVIENAKQYHLKVSEDVYNPDTTFVVIHGFTSKAKANSFVNTLETTDQYKVNLPAWVVSSTNYQTIQIHKNLDAYKQYIN